jgi:predicted nucleic acid-binding protein
MNCYVDSSIILKYFLSDDRTFEDVRRFAKVGSSELLLIECSRVFQRYRLQQMIDDDQLADLRARLERVIRNILLIEISDTVKNLAAGPFPTIIGSLDAIHLASALTWKGIEYSDELHMLSFDRQMCLCAQALGFRLVRSPS